MPHQCHTLKVFEHLQLLWMFIWLHTQTFTTKDMIPCLGDFPEAVILLFYTELSQNSLAQSLLKRLPMSYRADPYISCRRMGKWLHHGGDVCVIVHRAFMPMLTAYQNFFVFVFSFCHL
jgi:hypothetical protein